MNQVGFIGSASGWGAQIRETEKGPDTFQTSGVLDTLPFAWNWRETYYPLKSAEDLNLPNGAITLPFIEDMCLRVSQSVNQTLNHNQFPIVIGGDHSIAVGTWGGVVSHFDAFQNFGLIWIDAHMDSHTPETSESQAYHGMPLAALLGYGASALVNISSKMPIYRPEHVCLIGVRSYEEGEADLLNRLGVRVYKMDEVQKRGFQDVLKEALALVNKGTEGFGVTIDLDAFDPTDAPGVGSPEPNGLSVKEVLPALSLIKKDPSFKALEIVEFNPNFDKNNKTLHLMRDLLIHLVPTGRDKP